MIQPPPLKSGDTVAIVSTARKVTKAELQPTVKILESWGLQVKFGKNLFKASNQFAGTDEERLADLQSALNNKNVQAILFARGGYGTVRIIDGVNWKRFQKDPKWLIGYSDITVLHNHLHRHLDLESIHAPMAFNLPKLSANCLDVFKDTIFGKTLRYTSSKQSSVAEKLNRKGQASGILTGGNLSILYSIMGSQSDVDTAGKILFLEDLDEYVYHIDRMMMNLARNNKLSQLAGLIVGGMSEMRDNEIPFGKTAEEIIREAVEPYDYPVLFGFPAGHIPNNFPLILGRKVTLNVTEKMDLKFHA